MEEHQIFPTDWDQEIQNVVEDLLTVALAVELCRLAAGRSAPSLARFSGAVWQSLLSRCGDRLEQSAFSLKVWGDVLTAGTSPLG